MDWIIGMLIFFGGSFCGGVATFFGIRWITTRKMEDLTDQFTKECPECGEEVSTIVDECPECGHEFEEGENMFD